MLPFYEGAISLSATGSPPVDSLTLRDKGHEQNNSTKGRAEALQLRPWLLFVS
jgi:hypothetical protein